MRYSSFCLKYEDQFKKNTRGGENVKTLLSCGAGIGALTPSAFRIHDRGGCTRAMYVIDQENKYKMHCAAMNFSETHVAVGSSSSSKEDASVHLFDLSYEDVPIQSITLSNARDVRVLDFLGCYGGQSGVMVCGTCGHTQITSKINVGLIMMNTRTQVHHLELFRLWIGVCVMPWQTPFVHLIV